MPRGGIAARDDGLLGDGVDGDGVTRAALHHQQPHAVTGGLKAGGERLAIGIPNLQPGVVHHRRAAVILKGHAERIRRDGRTQTAAHAERESQRRIRQPLRPLRHREAVLQPASVVDEPLVQRCVPLVGKALPRGLHRRHAADGTLAAVESVALQLQPPLPRRALRLGDKAAPVKTGDPLLPLIARLPAGGRGLERMLSGIIGLANGGPVGFGDALRRLVGRGRVERGCEGEDEE